MSQPYVGEIRMFGGNFAPAGWAFCNGQIIPISENDTLFVLIGTTYGGDGQETFGLPDLQSRVPVHMGGAFVIGEKAGVETVTLTQQQLPVHTHTMSGSTNQATTNTVGGNIAATLLAAGTASAYGNVPPFKPLNANSIGPVGGNQPHDNIQPVLAISFIISLYGIFPSQT